MNGIYDPLGLISPYTVRAKLLMKNMWRIHDKPIGWDDAISNILRDEWISFLGELKYIENLTFDRCIKSERAIGAPTLITFSDGSESAFGACSYVRWELEDGGFAVNLIAAKNRITPMKTITIVRIEYCAAIVATRLRNFIANESRYKFRKEYFLVDSEIV